MKSQTIIQYLIKRINDLGVSEFFGVPGDYNFNILEEIGFNPDTKWVGCCNELNAGYAADGYARIKGMGAVVTTFGVGELSAINAVAGSYAEEVPIIKIVGIPKRKAVDSARVLHHCVGRPDYDVFCEIYSKITKYSVILSEENAQKEIETALSIAYNDKKPVYIALYDDLCKLPIKMTQKSFEKLKSNQKKLNSAVNIITERFNKSKKPVIISEYPILRYGLEEQMNEFVKKSGAMATTLIMGKSSVNENLDNYIGLYCGNMISKKTAELDEKSDGVVVFGILMTDFNSL